jgi:hypothetical protein
MDEQMAGEAEALPREDEAADADQPQGGDECAMDEAEEAQEADFEQQEEAQTD